MPGALDERDLSAEAADGLRHLDPHRPAPEDEQPPRDGLHAGDFAVRPDAVELAQARDGRNDRVGAGREDDVLRGVAGRRRPRRRPSPRVGRALGAASMPCVGQPALLPGVGVVRDHGSRARRAPPRRRPARSPPRRSRRGRPRPGAAASSTGCTPSTSTRRRRARARRARRAGRRRRAPPAQCSPGAPAADDDDVVVAHAAVPRRPAPPPCTRRTSRASSRLPRRCASRARRGRPPRAASRRRGRSTTRNVVSRDRRGRAAAS